MINEALYTKTVNILVDAYLNDTLRHRKCNACAVGNIIAANNGYEVNPGRSFRWAKGEQFVNTMWNEVFVTDIGVQRISLNNYKDDAKEQIDSTGYTVLELAKIEYAFEKCEYSSYYDEWMFNGLMAVIDTLDIIHQNTDTAITSTNKARFNKVDI